MQIEFTNPLALMLLALIPVALYIARRSLARLSRLRVAIALAARVLILLLVVLALAGLRIRTTSRDISLIFLVDVSASVALDSRQQVFDLINNEINRAGPRDYIGIVAFGREPSVEIAPTRKETLGAWRITEINSNPPRDYTNIAAALRLAAALVPEDAVGRFVLISDGNENLESATADAQLLRASGVEVYTRAIGTMSERGESRGEIAVREINAPESLAEGEAFDLKVTVDSTRDAEAVLRIYRNDALSAERQVSLAASGENIFILPQRIEQKGFYTFRAEVESLASDTFVQNNSRAAFAIVEGRPKTLYLYGDAAPSPAMTRVLREGNFAAEIRNAGGVPTTLAGFQDYDLVIFDNVPASAMTNEQMKMAQSYVRDLGGGFIMIGGDKSFGPGGYYKTPVEEMLPVSLDVRQKKHLPSLALALVIDKSGSMSGEKMDMTQAAAAATVEFLSERDSVGVVAFDDEATEVAPLALVENKQSIIRKIESIQPIGGTNMYPGIRMAHEWLQANDAQIKHIIVLSDGQSEAGDFYGLARAARNAGLTITTVAVGEDSDFETMERIAELGGGRFYAADRAENLPRIFTREAFLASRSTIIEEPFAPRLVRPTQATNGIDWSGVPQLGGYVGTAERDSLRSPAITSLISDKDDPVYAVWQYGLGRAAAFTSDAKGRWAAGWMNWPGFGQFWTQALRDTLRRDTASDLQPRVEINAGRGRVTVEAVTADGAFRNNLRLRAHVIAPDLTAMDLPLEQTAAGRYEAEFPATAQGAYLASVTEEGGAPAPVTGAVNSYSPEFNITGADESALAQVSETTGGQVLSANIDPTSDSGVNLFERRATRTRPHEIWETLLLAALLLLPFDVGVRRLHITREQVDEARDWIQSKFHRRAKEERVEEAALSLEQLKGARSRVRLSDGTTSLSDLKRSRTERSASRSRSSVDNQPAPQTQSARAEKAPAQVIQSNNPAPAQSAVLPEKETAAEADTNQAQPLASRLLDARRKKREQ